LPWNIDTFDYHHTLFTFHGDKVFFKSLDRPSINAGNSVVARIGDEAKHQKKEKLDQSAPAVRGDAVKFGWSPYFMSDTFCTDMPDTTLGNDDWILDMEKNIQCKGKVIWAVKTQSKKPAKLPVFDTGVEFVDIAPKDQKRISDVVNQLIKEGFEETPYRE